MSTIVPKNTFDGMIIFQELPPTTIIKRGCCKIEIPHKIFS